jgi:hypothetical protein
MPLALRRGPSSLHENFNCLVGGRGETAGLALGEDIGRFDFCMKWWKARGARRQAGFGGIKRRRFTNELYSVVDAVDGRKESALHRARDAGKCGVANGVVVAN